VTFDKLFDEKWLNVSVSLASVQKELETKKEQIEADILALQNLPEYSFEAIETYKTTLDINKALNEAHRLAEIAKKKAEMEAQAKAREEAINKAALDMATIGYTDFEDAKERINSVIEQQEPAKQWIGFKALLSEADAIALNVFFKSRNIEFEAI
jgi:hypothetical protein